MIICSVGHRQVQEEGGGRLGPSQPCLVVTRSPSPQASPRCGLCPAEKSAFNPSGSFFLQSRPGVVRVSLVKVLFLGGREGLSEPQNLALVMSSV